MSVDREAINSLSRFLSGCVVALIVLRDFPDLELLLIGALGTTFAVLFVIDLTTRWHQGGPVVDHDGCFRVNHPRFQMTLRESASTLFGIGIIGISWPEAQQPLWVYGLCLVGFGIVGVERAVYIERALWNQTAPSAQAHATASRNMKALALAGITTLCVATTAIVYGFA